ncbi:MAG: transporter permease [Herbinix sp.]|jgi:NitT/TauT family transport system permease protein|nr:transporter permease [Herbinix sp.]
MKLIQKMIKSQIVGFLSFILLWEIIHLIINTHTIPSPIETIAYTFPILDKLMLHSLASVVRVVTGIGISLIIGVPIGIYLGVNKLFHQLLSPFLYFIYPIPKVAFLPIFMLLFGLGNTSKIILIIWIVIFQIILSVRDGVGQIPEQYFKVMNSFQASSSQKYRFLVIPAILPQVFAGLRISIGISLASLFFAENYAATYGIGYFILSAWTKMNYIEMFSGIMVLGIIGVLLFRILDGIEAHCTPWVKR